jgi:hypothetical protein
VPPSGAPHPPSPKENSHGHQPVAHRNTKPHLSNLPGSSPAQIHHLQDAGAANKWLPSTATTPAGHCPVSAASPGADCTQLSMELKG